MDKLKLACKSNISYENILTAVKESFPESKTNTDSDITAYWEVCHNLSYTDKLIWLDSGLVIPQEYCCQVIKFLHSGHQGVSSMTKKANKTVNWLGMINNICNTHYNCHICNSNVPSQLIEQNSRISIWMNMQTVLKLRDIIT